MISSACLHELKSVHFFSFQTSRTALQEAVHREYTEIVTMLIKAQSAADERVRLNNTV